MSKQKGPHKAGRGCCSEQAKHTTVRAALKTLIVDAGCWHLIPPRFAEWLIRVLRLEGA
jgi:hypothetical protein